MSNLLSKAIGQARSLLDDSKAQFTTIDYMLPFAQMAQDELVKEALENPNLGHLYAVVVIPNIDVGATSLQSHFVNGGDLELLTEVTSLKERSISGSRGEKDWMWMGQVIDVPTFSPSAFNSYFAFRGDDIVLPGSDQNLDLRVFGKFSPKEFKDENSPVVPGTSVILAFRMAALIAGSRGNLSMFEMWESKAAILQDSFMINAIMEMQNCRNRNRPFSGRSITR